MNQEKQQAVRRFEDGIEVPLNYKTPRRSFTCPWNFVPDPNWFLKYTTPSPPQQPAKLKQIVTDFLLKTYLNVDFDDELVRKTLGIPTAQKMPMVYSNRKGFD